MHEVVYEFCRLVYFSAHIQETLYWCLKRFDKSLSNYLSHFKFGCQFTDLVHEKI